MAAPAVTRALAAAVVTAATAAAATAAAAEPTVPAPVIRPGRGGARDRADRPQQQAGDIPRQTCLDRLGGNRPGGRRIFVTRTEGESGGAGTCRQ